MKSLTHAHFRKLVPKISLVQNTIKPQTSMIANNIEKYNFVFLKVFNVTKGYKSV